jgi:hypothetical protein
VAAALLFLAAARRLDRDWHRNDPDRSVRETQ